MQISAMLIAAALLTGQNSAAPLSTAEVTNCQVTLAEEAEVPAQDNGVLTELKVKAGQTVEAGQILGEIDQSKSRVELRVAKGKLAVAQEKANDDINVRYARAAADVAKAAYQVSAEANKRVPGAVPQTALNELLLKTTETVLGIDKSQLDQRVAVHEADVARSEVDGAEEVIAHRQIRSPIDGVVNEMHRHLGEWVQAGDHVLHVVRIDRLWVEGYVSSAKYSRRDLLDRAVTVDVALPRDQHVQFPGTVIFTDPANVGDTFMVRAEIQNQKDGGSWVLNPGLRATMSIQLK